MVQRVARCIVSIDPRGAGILCCLLCGEPYRDHPLDRECDIVNLQLVRTEPRRKPPVSRKDCRCGRPSVRDSRNRYIGSCEDHR